MFQKIQNEIEKGCQNMSVKAEEHLFAPLNCTELYSTKRIEYISNKFVILYLKTCPDVTINLLLLSLLREDYTKLNMPWKLLITLVLVLVLCAKMVMVCF